MSTPTDREMIDGIPVYTDSEPIPTEIRGGEEWVVTHIVVFSHLVMQDREVIGKTKPLHILVQSMPLSHYQKAQEFGRQGGMATASLIAALQQHIHSA